MRRTGFVICSGCLAFAVMVAAPAAADKAAASRYYESAVMMVEQGDLKGAIIELKNALQQAPDLLAARVLQGKVYVLLELGADAEKQLTDANQLGADRSATLAPLAQAYLLQGKYRELIENIDPEGQSRRLQSELHAYRGYAYLELWEQALALEAFTTSERLNPDSGLASTGQALLLLRQRRLDEAAAHAERAIALAPKSPDAWNVMASVSHARGDLDRAVREYGETVALKPRHLDARIARAGIYLDQEKLAEAARDLEYLRKEYPKDPQSAYLQGVLFAKQGDREASESAFRKAADITDTYTEAYLGKNEKLLMLAGLVNFDLRRFEKAQNYLGQYIKQYPDSPAARKLQGSIFMQRGEFDRAIVTLGPGLKVAPNDLKILSMLGTAYLNTGQHKLADDMLERAVQISGGDPGVRTSLALNHLKAGYRRRAIQELTGIFEQDNRQIHAGIAVAQTHLEDGDVDRALQIAARMSALHPDHVELLNLLGSAQVRSGTYKEARATFEKALRLDPGFIQAEHSLGRLDILERDAAGARKRYARILERHADHVATMIELARLEDVEGRDEEAIRWLEKARSADKNSMEAKLYLVDLYIRAGKAGLALDIAREADLARPQDQGALAALARANLALGKPGVARVLYRRMASLANFNPETLYRTARYQLEADLVDDAIFSLQQALGADPDHLPLQIEFVQALLRAGRVAEAAEPARRIRAKHPQLAVGHRLVGDMFMQEGKHHEAEKSYQEALKRDASSRHAISVYRAMSGAGDRPGAIRFLDQWLAAHPDDQPARMALAEEYLRAGRLEEAGAHYELVLKSNPRLPFVLNNLANIYHRLKDQRALGMAERAYELAPEDVAVNDTLGWILANQGQADRSLRYLRDAHYRDAANPEIRYHIAFALERLGRRDEARRELAIALRSGQVFDGIEDARRLQKELGE